MNSSIYGKLAFTNIKNNGKTYIPYIITAVLTVMMYYIMNSLYRNDGVGDGSLKSVLFYAVWVVAIFAVIFLFYTNSFLIKRRKKEIAVYNILGMGKRHIAKMLALETFIIAVISLALGIVGGVIFSKLMNLVLLKLIHYDINLELNISLVSMCSTLILFVIIFALTLIYNLMQIKLASPVELLQGGSQGEKEPRTKWLMAVFGVIALAVGYYIAITTEKPLAAISNFFIAVVCVILGTYALFTAGSIALLKILRKNKKFYYKTKHFTSVSGMIYRMKQNAVGLANICILSTMVLIMISTTISLYTGMDDVLKTRFPQEFRITAYDGTDENIVLIDRIVEEETKKEGVKTVNNLSHRESGFTAVRTGTAFSLKGANDFSVNDAYEIDVIPLEDYNRMEEKNTSLAKDEVILYSTDPGMYGEDQIQIGNQSFKVKEELKEMKLEEKNTSRLMSAYYVVVSDTDVIWSFIQEAYGDSELNEDYVKRMANIRYVMSFDLNGDEKACTKAQKSLISRVEQEAAPSVCESRELSRESFYILYGGLLFIGIYLGFMFLMATVLIIYYKQISEGFDDKERYQIMQKVGMGKKEVRQSIRSQVLTVFFLPLIAAIIHIAAAFKVVTKLLATLQLVNVPLFLTCTIVTVVVFAIFYAVVFMMTAREYYKIVN